MHEPEVAFVVLCYNLGRYVGECVDSILGQEGTGDFEVVVVDDASSDDSAAVLRRYTDPRVRVITHAKNQGHIGAVEHGLRAARGRYVVRVDADDRYRPGYLASVLPVIRHRPNVGLVYANVDLIDEAGHVTGQALDDAHGNGDAEGNELVRLLERNFICSPTVIARRQAWLNALPVPSGLAFHDWYFTLMIAREWDLFHRGAILADYRVHPGNLHTQIVRDRTEEPSIFRMLDMMFAGVDRTTTLGRSVIMRRRYIYGAHYLTLARKYFGTDMIGDARRCYLRAIAHRPEYLADWSVARQCLGTVIGQRAYTRMKALARTVKSPRSSRVAA